MNSEALGVGANAQVMLLIGGAWAMLHQEQDALQLVSSKRLNSFIGCFLLMDVLGGPLGMRSLRGLDH